MVGSFLSFKQMPMNSKYVLKCRVTQKGEGGKLGSVYLASVARHETA